MLHKSFDIIDAKADAERGTFEATVAVFGNVDKGGDRIVSKAFDKTLAKWQASGDPIPVILSHQWDNPFHHIGVVDPANVMVTSKGLRLKGHLDIEDNDVARQVHRLMARRSLKEFSFGYSVPRGGQRRAKDGANELLEIDLAEVGPTLKGMNPATELHAVKSALGVEEPPKDPNELRKEADRVAREEIEAHFPDVPPESKVETEQVDEPVAVLEEKAIGGGTRGAIGNLVRYYASKPHPFTECVRDNTKRFGEERAKRICATLKRMGGRKADEPDTDWEQELYDAADGDVEGLLEMLHTYMEVNGESLKDVGTLRKEADRVAREETEREFPEVPTLDSKTETEEPKEPTVADLLAEVLPAAEIEGIKVGDLKAAWTAAFINDLPDSAFLYVEPGGSKDADGKTTPRSLRHFPYKDANGSVDLPHLRNALARIPQSNLSQDVKDRLVARAQRILDNSKSVDLPDVEGSRETRSVDPLRKQADAVALEFASDGANLRKPPKTPVQPKREPELALGDLKKRMREEILVHLSGGTLQ
jgi:HK97 family phage prohead protease